MITLAQHLAAHWLRNSITDDTDHDDNDWSTYCQCGYRIATTTAADVEALHREHVAATWQQARTITTRAQLDALPEGTLLGLMDEGNLIDVVDEWDHDDREEMLSHWEVVVLWQPEDGDQ